MGDEIKEKSGKDGSSHEKDSFEKQNGVPISLEPVFSTAGKNIRIGVKQESIDKSKKMLNNDLQASSSSNTSFSGPVTRAKNQASKAFVSPFRRDGKSTSSGSSKRQATEDISDFEPPPPKKAAPSSEHTSERSTSSPEKEMKEFHADVLRVSRIYEKEKFRMILQEQIASPLILATCSYRRGKDLKFGDRIHVHSEIRKKNDSNDVIEVCIKKVIENKKDGARIGIRRHLISTKPYCIRPRLLNELSNNKIKKTVVQVTILDLNATIYDGCNMCKHTLEEPSASKSKKSSSKQKDGCKSCRHKKTESADTIFSRMRVTDLTGQMLVNVNSKTMEKVLSLFGYQGIDQWHQFKTAQERKNYVFRPLLIEIEKTRSGDWECTDVSSVDWSYYGEHLKEMDTIEQLQQKISERFLVPKMFQEIHDSTDRRIDLLSGIMTDFEIQDGSVFKLKHSLLPQWEVYLVTSNFENNIDHASKKKKVIEASTILENLQKSAFFATYSAFAVRRLNFMKEYSGIMDEADECIKRSVEIYFAGLLETNPSNPKLSFKYSRKPVVGIQAGFICEVQCGSSNQRYYVKSHSTLSSRQNADMRELFMYILLNKLGVGPLVHIIPNQHTSRIGVYIATIEVPNFMPSHSAKLSPKAALELDFLRRLLCLSDLHADNYGIDAFGNLAIVDFRIGGYAHSSKNHNVWNNIKNQPEKQKLAKEVLTKWNLLEALCGANDSFRNTKELLEKTNISCAGSKVYARYFSSIKLNAEECLKVFFRTN